jgi:hypothetical protein
MRTVMVFLLSSCLLLFACNNSSPQGLVGCWQDDTTAISSGEYILQYTADDFTMYQRGKNLGSRNYSFNDTHITIYGGNPPELTMPYWISSNGKLLQVRDKDEVAYHRIACAT